MSRPGDAAALPLTRSVRARLLPLLVLLVFVVALSAPLAIYALRVAQLRDHAGAVGAQVAGLIQREARHHPELWRYNTPKLVEHQQAYQRHDSVRRIVVTDRDGRPVTTPGARDLRALRRAKLLWHPVRVRVGDRQVGTVWVAMELAPAQQWFFRTMTKFALLALILGVLIYLIPLRTLARAEAGSAALLQELEASQGALAELNRSLERRIEERSAALGRAYRELQDKERRLREISGRAMAFGEAERRAIGRELHDGAGQALTAVRINLQLLGQRGDATDDVKALAARTVGLVDETLEEIRRAVRSLGPAIVDEVGLGAAVRRHCEDAGERTGLEIRCTVDEALAPQPTAVENACYRVLQEALNNVAKHADARRVTVSLATRADRLVLSVKDDGRGFDPDAPAGDGQGLTGIRERAELLGGTLGLESAPGRGTTLTVELGGRGAPPEEREPGDERQDAADA